MGTIRTGQAGNYATKLDFGYGMDPEMVKTLSTPNQRPSSSSDTDAPLNKVESDYLKSRGGASSAMKAIQRVRRINSSGSVSSPSTVKD
jgi:hypothetical protein